MRSQQKGSCLAIRASGRGLCLKASHILTPHPTKRLCEYRGSERAKLLHMNMKILYQWDNSCMDANIHAKERGIAKVPTKSRKSIKIHASPQKVGGKPSCKLSMVKDTTTNTEVSLFINNIILPNEDLTISIMGDHTGKYFGMSNNGLPVRNTQTSYTRPAGHNHMH